MKSNLCHLTQCDQQRYVHPLGHILLVGRKSQVFPTLIVSETGWDLEPFAAVQRIHLDILYPGYTWISCILDTPLLEQQNTKKLYGTKNNCMPDVENGLEDMGRGKGKLGRSERVAWTYIHYQM